MRHGKRTRTLGRLTSHRLSMLNNLTASLILHGRITTTEARAKEVAKVAEHIITIARKGDLASRRRIISALKTREVVKELYDVVIPKYSEGKEDARTSGYTRQVKIGPRRGDAAFMVILELV